MAEDHIHRHKHTPIHQLVREFLARPIEEGSHDLLHFQHTKRCDYPAWDAEMKGRLEEEVQIMQTSVEHESPYHYDLLQKVYERERRAPDSPPRLTPPSIPLCTRDVLNLAAHVIAEEAMLREAALEHAHALQSALAPLSTKGTNKRAAKALSQAEEDNSDAIIFAAQIRGLMRVLSVLEIPPEENASLQTPRYTPHRELKKSPPLVNLRKRAEEDALEGLEILEKAQGYFASIIEHENHEFSNLIRKRLEEMKDRAQSQRILDIMLDEEMDDTEEKREARVQLLHDWGIVTKEQLQRHEKNICMYTALGKAFWEMGEHYQPIMERLDRMMRGNGPSSNKWSM